VVRWLYESIGRPAPHEEGTRDGGDKGRDGVRQRERSEEEGRGPRKRPRSPSAERDVDRSPSGTDMRRAKPRFFDVTNTLANCHVGVGGDKAGGGAAPGRVPDRPALEELLELTDRLCQHGDHCQSVQGEGEGSCDGVHSAGLAALKGLSVSGWVRETALTFLRVSPSHDMGGQAGRARKVAWKAGLKNLVRRWLNSSDPEMIEAEAPPVPGPHPDADPSGAPMGAGRGDMEELRDLLARLCIRAYNCKFLGMGLCRAMHPATLTTSGASRWARDELERLLRTHPYGHLKLEAYERGRCESVEQVWRAGLIRQVDKWIELQEADER
jgi:hypothetical protein